MSRRHRSRRVREIPLPGTLQDATFLILPKDIGIPSSVLVHGPFIFQLRSPDHALTARLYVSKVWPDRLVDLDISQTTLILSPARVSTGSQRGATGRTSSPLTRKALIRRSNSIFFAAICIIWCRSE